MSLPIYPKDDLDDSSVLLNTVGNFWADLFAQSEQVKSLFVARAARDKQITQNFDELLASVSRLKLKPLRKLEWHLLTFDTAQRNQTILNRTRYGVGTDTYGQGVTYGQTQALQYTTYPLPAKLSVVPVLSNRLSAASYMAINGSDYVVQDGVILFLDDPASNPNIITEDGKFTLWVFGSEWDERDLFYQFGYVISQEQKSSHTYRDFINANYDSMIEGTSARALDHLLEAFADVPLTKTNDEIVTQIFDFQNKSWVVTDKNVYGYALGATLLVTVGDQLKQGQPLTDTLQIYGFNRGELPDSVKALAIGKNFMVSGIYQDIVFENKTYATNVYTKDDGYTAFEFPVQGNPGDVEKFWQDTHDRGVAAGATLAMLLDSRTVKTGQPGPLALPATINPLLFLTRNILRNNFILLVLRPSKFGSNALRLNLTYALRRIVPPHIGVMVLIALDAETDQITMDGISSTDAGLVEEDVLVYFGNSVEEIIDADTLVDDQDVTIRLIQGRCE